MFEGLDTGDKGALITTVGFGVLVLMALIPRLKSIGIGKSLQMALIWIVIFGGLIIVVSQWRTIAQAVDPAAPVASENEVRVAARDDGHFYVRALVNGESVLFMVDTGATDIVLTRETARRLGFGDLVYNGFAETANGAVRTADVRLDTLAVGPIKLDNIRASVNEGDLGANLLGMRFLSALPGWRVENNTLVLNRI